MITFVTTNAKKASQLSLHMEYPVTHISFDTPEVQSLDPVEIVKAKAYAAYDKVKSTVLVEDTSLTFHALGRLPGPLIKWFLSELDNKGLCELLRDKDRSATASVYFCLFDGIEARIYDASLPGKIVESPAGERGFGWDSIFIPEGCTKTWGEMNADEQKETSMRRVALAKLKSYLDVQETEFPMPSPRSTIQ